MRHLIEKLKANINLEIIRPYLNINTALIVGGLVVLFFIINFFVWWNKDISIINIVKETVENKDESVKSPISGVSCENKDQRPIAIMMSSDTITRPLSGISQADIVFEMPVTPGGITRFMAVFQCFDPGDIGSIRSARDGFIGLAAGLGAVYVHWGGEKEALTKLNNHIVDNIDALIFEGSYFFRKEEVRQPHDGFAKFEDLQEAIDDLKYNKKNTFEGYPHTDEKPSKNIANIAEVLSLDYPFPLDVQWVYDNETDLYKRIRGARPEIDNNNGNQVTASVIIVMNASPKLINQDYMDIDLTGIGDTVIYQNGIKINGTWEKDATDITNKLYFYDSNGDEIKFTPGRIWVNIITNND